MSTSKTISTNAIQWFQPEWEQPTQNADALIRGHFKLNCDMAQKRGVWPCHVEEVVADALVRAWKTFDIKRGDFFSWWRRKVRNRSRNYKRHQRMLLKYVDFNKESSECDVPCFERERTERQELLRQALDQLHPDNATLIDLYYMQSLRLMEIRKLPRFSRLSKSGLKMRLQRSKKRLKQIILHLQRVPPTDTHTAQSVPTPPTVARTKSKRTNRNSSKPSN